MLRAFKDNLVVQAHKDVRALLESLVLKASPVSKENKEMKVHLDHLVPKDLLDPQEKLVKPVRLGKLGPKVFKVLLVNAVHRVRKVMQVKLVLMVLKVPLVQWVQLVQLETVVNLVKTAQTANLVNPENKVHAGIQVVLELMAFLVELVSKDLSVIRAGWVPLAILDRKVNEVAKGLLGPEAIKVQLVFLENRARKALKGQWERWVTKVNKVQLVCPDLQVVMVLKVLPVQLVIRVHLVPLVHLLSHMTWLSTMTLLRLNILVLTALTSLMDHVSSQLEHVSILLM